MIHEGLHRRCGGHVSLFTLPQGYDEQGALPDTAVWVCHRCGVEMDTDHEVVDDRDDADWDEGGEDGPLLRAMDA